MKLNIEDWGLMPDDPPCMALTPGSPEAALVALDDLAKKFQTDVTALCMAQSADNPPASERQRRAYEVVAVMKQRLQHFEKSIALTVTPLDHEVSPESGAPGLTNGKEAMRPNTVSSCATAVKAVQQVIGKPAGAESIKPDRSGNSGEPTLTSMDCDGIDDKSDPVNAELYLYFSGGVFPRRRLMISFK